MTRWIYYLINGPAFLMSFRETFRSPSGAFRFSEYAALKKRRPKRIPKAARQNKTEMDPTVEPKDWLNASHENQSEHNISCLHMAPCSSGHKWESSSGLLPVCFRFAYGYFMCCDPETDESGDSILTFMFVMYIYYIYIYIYIYYISQLYMIANKWLQNNKNEAYSSQICLLTCPLCDWYNHMYLYW